MILRTSIFFCCNSFFSRHAFSFQFSVLSLSRVFFLVQTLQELLKEKENNNTEKKHAIKEKIDEINEPNPFFYFIVEASPTNLANDEASSGKKCEKRTK